jgi:hypothetical protein
MRGLLHGDETWVYGDQAHRWRQAAIGAHVAKVRYRDLAKNTERLWVTCVLANLFMVRRRLSRA